MAQSDKETKAMSTWDSAYERKAVIALSFGFGLVGLDRWIIGPLFPVMSRDLGLDYAVLGSAAGALALAWGVFSIVAGNLSDRYGRRKILIPALVLFSCLSGMTGMVIGLTSLLLVRGLMGTAEGAYLPTSVAAVAEASHPLRRGRNQGIMLGMFPLFGFGLGPILATQLLEVVPSWREVFMIVAIPGLITAVILYRILREPEHLRDRVRQPKGISPNNGQKWNLVFGNRNVLLASLSLICAMSCIFVLGALVPSYLTDSRNFSITTMGLVMSAMGWGGFLGEVVILSVSDYIGRRLTTVIAFIGSLVFIWVFFHASVGPIGLFFLLSMVSFFGLGLTGILTGPIATEAVSPTLAATAIGMVSGVGEIFGGGIAPVIAGFVAKNYGIDQIFWIPVVGLAIGTVVACFIKESAPRLALRAAKELST
jgi:MFS family permease